MGKAKITPVQVYIIGIILSVIAAVSIYFALIKPSGEAYDTAKQQFDAADAQALKMPAAQQDRKKALAKVAEAEAKWARYDRQYMFTRDGNNKVVPIVDISNLLDAMQQLWREQITVLQPKLDTFLRADKTVQVVRSSLAVPAPSANPNTVGVKAFSYDLGQVSVVGTFDNVLNNAERWNKFDRLVLMDGLTLAGYSPVLEASYTLHIYEFTHGDKAGDQIPQAAGGAPGGGGGFGPGDGGGPPDGATGSGPPGGP